MPIPAIVPGSNAMLKIEEGFRANIRAHLEDLPMPEPLPEHQKTQLIVRSPLSTEGFVSIYFSSPEGLNLDEKCKFLPNGLASFGQSADCNILSGIPPWPTDCPIPVHTRPRESEEACSIQVLNGLSTSMALRYYWA
jgi:hypothetical protein